MSCYRLIDAEKAKSFRRDTVQGLEGIQEERTTTIGRIACSQREPGITLPSPRRSVRSIHRSRRNLRLPEGRCRAEGYRECVAPESEWRD